MNRRVICTMAFMALISWGAAVGLPSNVTAGEMADFGSRIDRELSDLNSRIEALGKDAQKAGANTRQQVDEQLRQARERWQDAKHAYDRYVEKGKAASAELRDGVDAAMDDLRDAYDKAAEKMR